MKKQITVLTTVAALLFSCLQNVSAQNWSKTGNAGTDPALNFIGTTDNKAFKIRTNNINRVTILSNGKVGIGTSTPDSKLHLQNSGTSKSTLLHIENSNASNDSVMITLSNNGLGSAIVLNAQNNYYAGIKINRDGGTGTGIQINNNSSGEGLTINGTNSCSSSLIHAENSGTGSCIYLMNNNDNNLQPTLDVYTHGIGAAGSFSTTNASSTNPILDARYIDVNSSTSDKIAVNGESNVNNGWGVGGNFAGGYKGLNANSDISNIGAYETNYGGCIKSFNSGTGNTYGLFAEAGGIGTGGHYGVYGKASGNSNVAYAGYFVGDLAYTGTLTQTSDRKLKNNIQPLNNALTAIMKLKPSSYNFRTDEFKTMNLATGKHFGLIAQELQQVFPELVTENLHPAEYDSKTKEKIADEVKYLGVNYTELIPVLIEGMQEQQKQIEQKDKSIEDLKNEILEIKKAIGLNTTSVSEKIAADKNVSAINKIVPNPFSNETEIQLSIPSASQKVVVRITDETGKLVKEISVNTKGNTTVKLNTTELLSGVYFCSLIIDGNKIATEKMNCTK